MRRRAIGVLAAGLWLVSVGGCVVPGDPSTEDDVALDESRPDVADRQIAFDFANAIVQLVGVEATTIRFPRSVAGRQPVLDALRAMLGEAGYAIQQVNDGVAEDVARHDIVAIERDGELTRRHEVAVGGVELRRAYRDTGTGRVLPTSALFVRGADAGAVSMMDDRLFGLVPERPDGAAPPASGDDSASPGGEASGAMPEGLIASYRYLFADSPDDTLRRAAIDAVEEGEAPDVVPETAELGTDIGPGTYGRAGNDGALALVPAGNVHELGRSNHASLLDPLDVVVEHVITFGPSSDKLDRNDVALIDDVLGRFDATTDVVAVVGYSTGGRAGTDGNRRMALRRADRVRRALTAVGVPSDRIVVEGYWSESRPLDGRPPRSAIVRLKRRPV